VAASIGRLFSFSVVLALTLVLGACGGEDETASSPPAADATPNAAATQSGSSDGGFCDQAKANGADGASWGEVQAFAPKDVLARDIAAAQEAMRGLTPPDEIADAWQTRKRYLAKLQAAVAKLPAGGRLSDDPSRSDASLIYNQAGSKAVEQITDYWFDACG
jgi:hypothetical protein